MVDVDVDVDVDVGLYPSRSLRSLTSFPISSNVISLPILPLVLLMPPTGIWGESVLLFMLLKPGVEWLLSLSS